ncbi:MAG: rod shape-determining protein MreD [Candidatus Eremiobacteraeota bacterium]|nr:rod shape-determining protein MreD [Candidatus Eremiobacteraeota bacterium]
MQLSRSNGTASRYDGPSWERAALYLVAALIAQVTFLHYMTLRGATFSVVLIVVIWFSILADVRRAAIFGFIAGFCEDMLGLGTGGAWTISTTITALLAGALSRTFFADSIPLVTGIVVISTLVRDAIFWMVMKAQGFPPGLATLHFHQALWQALLNAIFVTGAMLIYRYREHLRFREA